MSEVIEEKMKAVVVDSENDDEALDGGNRRKSYPPVQMVLVRGESGSVKWFSRRRGYGFINRDDNGEDIFFHAHSIVRITRLPLFVSDGTKVEFDIVKGSKGLEAFCVSGPGGMRVGRIFNPDRDLGKKHNNNGGGSPHSRRRNDDERDDKDVVGAKEEEKSDKADVNTEGKPQKPKSKKQGRKRQAKSVSKDIDGNMPDGGKNESANNEKKPGKEKKKEADEKKE